MTIPDRMNDLEQRVTRLEEAVIRIEQRLDAIETRLANLEANFRTLMQVTIAMWVTTMMGIIAMFIAIIART